MVEQNLTEMTSEELMEALIKDNALAEELEMLNLWNEFDSEVWSDLLSKQSQFADRCNKWRFFAPHDWSNLLSKQPQLWVYCPEESVEKIIIKPELADECKCWNRFDSHNWVNLLSDQPQFADKCPDKIYDEFTNEQWDELETKHPDIFTELHMLSTLRKLTKD